MDLWLWYAFYPHTWAALVTVLAAGLAFNIAHALGQSRPGSRGRARVAACARATRAQRAYRGRMGVRLLLVASPRPCWPVPLQVRPGRPTDPRRSSRAGRARTAALPSKVVHRTGLSRPGPLSGSWPSTRFPAERARSLEFLRARTADVSSDADLALRVVALAALGETIDEAVLTRLRRHRPGVLVNETIWTVIALRAAGEQPPPALVQAIVAAQAKGGGFGWSLGGNPDSNDTAAAIQALRASGVGGAPVRRALVALRAFQNRDGGFALTKGRESDAQSTAWAIQALLSAGQKAGKPPFRYLSRLRRADGSYRYSAPLRDNAGLGHRTGAPCPRWTPVSASLDRGWSASRRRSTMQARRRAGGVNMKLLRRHPRPRRRGRLPGRCRRRQDLSGRVDAQGQLDAGHGHRPASRRRSRS